MSPAWLHHHPHQSHPRSSTPPPRPPPRSYSPDRKSSIPRSLSVLHTRPQSAHHHHHHSPSTLPPHPTPIFNHDASTSPPPPPPPPSAPASLVDYSAIQKIADGVERMVRSWSSEKSGRAHMYARAYDTLASSRRCSAPSWSAGEQQQQQQQQHQQLQQQQQVNNGQQSPADISPPAAVPHAQPVQWLGSPEPRGEQNSSASWNLQSPAEPVKDLEQSGPDVSSDIEGRYFQHHQEGAMVDDARNGPQAAPSCIRTHGHGWIPVRPGSAMLAPSRLSHVSGFKNELATNTEALIEEDDGDYSVSEMDHNRYHHDQQQHHININGGSRSFNSRAEYGNLLNNDLRHASSTRKAHRNQRSDSDVVMPPLSCGNNQDSVLVLREGEPVKLIRSRAPSSTGRISSSITPFDGKIDQKLDDKYESKVQELEISLLECATEYEVQIVEMKMKMLQMRSEFRKQDLCSQNKALAGSNTQDANVGHVKTKQNPSSEVEPSPDCLKKRVSRLQYEKDSGVHESLSPKQKGRHLELQKRNLDDKENLVACLQKLLGKKEQELVDSKIREKELTGQIQDLQSTFQRGRVTHIEPKKLLSLLLALSEWLQSVKVGVIQEDPYIHRRAYQNVHALAHMRVPSQEPASGRFFQSPRIDNLQAIVNKEIKSLQDVLGKITDKKSK